jgi:TonB family protein
MKRIVILLVFSFFYCSVIQGQIKCDSCEILMKKYSTSGDYESYETFYKFCAENIIDTTYLDLKNNVILKTNAVRYQVIKSDKCRSHKFYNIYSIVDNKLISSVETYNNDTVFIIPDELPISTERYKENEAYFYGSQPSSNTLNNSNGGTVYLNMLILKDGKVECIKILRGVDKYLDADALKFVGNMPSWLPAIKNGKKVICRINYTFKFRHE